MDKLISLETAQLAKEKGFNDSCDYVFVESWNKDIGIGKAVRRNQVYYPNVVAEWQAPTQSHLQCWLREKYHIYCHVASNSLTVHFPMNEVVTVDGSQMSGPQYVKNFPSYETALEFGLQEALKLIK